MINKKVIDTLYKRYNRRPKSTDQLNIALLFEGAHPMHDIEINEDQDIVINSTEPMSPFHLIPIELVHAIVDFDEHVAIVLANSIIFLSKKESDNPVSVHLKPFKPSLKQKLLNAIGRRSLAAAIF